MKNKENKKRKKRKEVLVEGRVLGVERARALGVCPNEKTKEEMNKRRESIHQKTKKTTTKTTKTKQERERKESIHQKNRKKRRKKRNEEES